MPTRIARRFTGAFRVVFDGAAARCTRSWSRPSRRTPRSNRRCCEALPPRVRPSRLVLWPYAEFPFGMTLDYERKFQHYVPGDVEPN